MEIECRFDGVAFPGDVGELKRKIAAAVAQIPWDGRAGQLEVRLAISPHMPGEVIAERVQDQVQRYFAPGWEAGDAIPVDENGRPTREFKMGMRPPNFEEQYRKVRGWLEDPDSFFRDKGATACHPHTIYNPKFAHLLDSEYLSWPEQRFRFRGETIKGGEINYYFLGMYFREVGLSKSAVDGIVATWKYVQYRPQGTDEVVKWGLNLLTCQRLARLGYDEYVPRQKSKSTGVDVDEMNVPGWEFFIEDKGFDIKTNYVLGLISDYYGEITPKARIHYHLPDTNVVRTMDVNGARFQIKSAGEAQGYCDQHWRWVREQLASRGLRPMSAKPRG